jgi:hypothetical protein
MMINDLTFCFALTAPIFSFFSDPSKPAGVYYSSIYLSPTFQQAYNRLTRAYRYKKDPILCLTETSLRPAAENSNVRRSMTVYDAGCQEWIWESSEEAA